MTVVAEPHLEAERRAFPLKAHVWFILLLLGFSAVVLPSVGDGVGSWDGHKIIRSVRALLDRHEIVPSRLPGHPTTEFYLYGGVGWLSEHLAGVRFGDTLYLWLAWLAAVGVAILLYAWLVRSVGSPVRAALAASALLFSPEFLAQTLNGDDFVVGLLFLLGAVVVLGKASTLSRGRIGASLGLFALSTGCRPELFAAGLVLYPLYFLTHRTSDRKLWVGTLVGGILALVLVWLPVLATRGFHTLHDPRMSGAEILLAWAYKLVFACFGFPVSFLLFSALAGAVIAIARRGFAWPAREGFAELLSVGVSVGYIAAFLFLPHKPAYVLVALPFLLWLVARRSMALLTTVMLLTLVSVFVKVDIFRARLLTTPHVTSGSYASAVEGKPARRAAYLRALSRVPVEGRTALVGDAWSWVYEFNRDRHGLNVTPVLSGRRFIGYAIEGAPDRILVPRELAETADIFALLDRAGYHVAMDRVLWRTLYQRYAVRSTEVDQVVLAGVSVRLLSVEGATE